ncbi:oligopeptide ABC transporter permease [Tuberibacillus sp. Marseille-P3662]|uniref:oligopeptide ABC transporter permease n=1 Tax=Tuberibacillus sp. Marseille-P3662 TaxID=1965358 RepID=UPI000A1C8490|nr:oligopeptide ABC transporter permease [Tuberibacillus sp. Marseille-P3662]
MATSKDDISQDLFEPANIQAGKEEEITRKSIGFWQDAMRRLSKNKGAMASLVIILLIVAMAFIGPTLNKWGIDDQDLLRHNLPPQVSGLSSIHWLPFDGLDKNGDNIYESRGIEQNFWFGTDEHGRDIWTRVWEGTKISLFIGLVAALADFIIGVIYGGISGYFGGRIDDILQRIIEILIGIPQLVLVILLIMVMEPGLTAIILAIAMTGWIGQSRIVRGQTLQLKQMEYVLAARTLGATSWRLIRKHLLPNTVGMIIITTMFSVPAAIFTEAFLSFIGLGVMPPQASLGSLIKQGYEVFQLHPYQALFPGVLISLLLICFNIFADGLRDALDPKLRQ